jgi:hypothetical protein
VIFFKMTENDAVKEECFEEKFLKLNFLFDHIGDYNEKPIFINGDSLIYDEIYGDYTNGYLSSLQIIYAIEKKIEIFQRGFRKTEIIFFEVLDNFWKNPIQKLLRKVVKVFLQKNFFVKDFYSPIYNGEFAKYIEKKYPTFILFTSKFFL